MSFSTLALTAALAAGLAGPAGAALRAGFLKIGADRGARLDAPDAPGRTRPALAASIPARALSHANFVSSQDQGEFGEALTILAMAARGYRPVNGKPGTGPQGIDGVFLRDGPEGWEAVLIETKTGSSAYADRQMDDAKLLDDLRTLYVETASEAGQAVYQALHDALQARAGHVKKELWRHDLGAGTTQITLLGRSGERLPRGRRMSLAPLVEALAAIVSEIDRQRTYLKR
ncbi:MAG: hypothetical protein ACOC05_11900 [Oceanicaulis sp.]